MNLGWGWSCAWIPWALGAYPAFPHGFFSLCPPLGAASGAGKPPPATGICLPEEEDGPANPSGAAPRRARAEDGISLIKSRFFPKNPTPF